MNLVEVHEYIRENLTISISEKTLFGEGREMKIELRLLDDVISSDTFDVVKGEVE